MNQQGLRAVVADVLAHRVNAPRVPAYFVAETAAKDGRARPLKYRLRDTPAGPELELRLQVLPARVHHAEQLRIRLQQFGLDLSASGLPPETDLEERALLVPLPPASATAGRAAALAPILLRTRLLLPPSALPTGTLREGLTRRWRVLVEGFDDGEPEEHRVDLHFPLPGEEGAWPELAQLPALPPSSDIHIDLPAGVDECDPVEPETPAVGVTPYGVGDEVGLDPGVLARRPAAPVPALRLLDDGERWVAAFTRTRWRVGAVLCAALAGALTLAARTAFDEAGIVSAPGTLLALAGAVGAIVAAAHFATRRWRLIVDSAGLTLDVGSAIRARGRHLGQPLAWTRRRASGTGRHQRHELVVASTLGEPVVVVPDLPGVSQVESMGSRLLRALAHRRGRFAMQEPAGALTRPLRSHVVVLPMVLASTVGAVGWAIRAFEAGPSGLPVLRPTRHLAADWQQRFHRLTVEGFRDLQLIDAVRYGDSAAAARLLSQRADPDLRLPDGRSLLMQAVAQGQGEVVEVLLSAGARVNDVNETSPTQRGDTALLLAMYRGRIDLARRLIAAGARLDMRNMWDWGPAHMAAQAGCIPCLELLRDAGAPLHEPASASRGETPLMLAAARGQVETLAWFVEQGGDPERRDPSGHDALGWARFFRQPATERWIVERSAAASAVPRGEPGGR